MIPKERLTAAINVSLSSAIKCSDTFVSFLGKILLTLRVEHNTSCVIVL